MLRARLVLMGFTGLFLAGVGYFISSGPGFAATECKAAAAAKIDGPDPRFEVQQISVWRGTDVVKRAILISRETGYIAECGYDREGRFEGFTWL